MEASRFLLPHKPKTPKRDNAKISEKVLKRLEDKIRKVILDDTGEVLVTTKCQEFLEKLCAKSRNNHYCPDLMKSNDWKGEVVTQEIDFLKNSLALLQKDCNTVSDNTDHILGSVTFIAGYDDMYLKISEISRLSYNVSNIKSSVNKINYRQTEVELHLDQLELYGQRENLEIHGISVNKNENINQIVKDLFLSLNVKLDDTYIST